MLRVTQPVSHSVRYTHEFDEFRVTTEVESSQLHIDSQCKYTAKLTLSPATDQIEISDTQIRINTSHGYEVAAVRQLPASESPDDSVSYLIAVSNAPVRQAVQLTLSSSSTLERASHGQSSTVEQVVLPRKHTLVVLSEFADLTLPSTETATELYRYIGKVYSPTSSPTAVMRFLSHAQTIVPPERYLVFYSAIMQTAPRLVKRGLRVHEYISRCVFELCSPRVFPDTDSDWITELATLTDSLPGISSPSVGDLTCTGLVQSVTASSDTYENIVGVLTTSGGDRWPQTVDSSVFGLALGLLFEFEDTYDLQQMASRRRSPATPSDYSRLKEQASNQSLEDRPQAWATILPVAANRSRGDFLHVLGNTVYWRAGQLNSNTESDDVPAQLYRIASDILESHGNDTAVRIARARAKYIRGLDHMFSSRPESARDEFISVLEVDTDEDPCYDTYSYSGALEQLCELYSDRLADDDVSLDSALTTVRTVQSALPEVTPQALIHTDRYVSSLRRLEGIQSELVSRKLITCSEDSLQHVKLDHADSELETAIERYTLSDSPADLRRAEQLRTGIQSEQPSVAQSYETVIQAEDA